MCIRDRSYRLTPEERHEYARYLYEKQYHRYPAVANQMLLVMARMSVLLNNYERAAQELADIRIDKFNPCLLYTSDAADEEDSVDLGGRRNIKKKKKTNRDA